MSSFSRVEVICEHALHNGVNSRKQVQTTFVMRAASASALRCWMCGTKAAGSCLNLDSDTNLPMGRRRESRVRCVCVSVWGGGGKERRTVVDAFGDGLEHLDVDGRGRAIVP